MSKDHSFDIVSQVDLQEVDNAVNQASKEVLQRYDLKNSGATVTFERGATTVTVSAPDEFLANQVIDVVATKLVRREVDLKALQWGGVETGGGGAVKRVAKIVCGIDQDIARKINKDIRDQKLKVKVQIEGDKVRVQAGKIDDLQAVIAFLKQEEYGIPLQYINYR